MSVPPKVQAAAAALAEPKPIRRGSLSERYMKCGFGICGQCALDDLLTCIDGPVLDAEQLDGKQDFGKYHRTATGRRMTASRVE